MPGRQNIWGSITSIPSCSMCRMASERRNDGTAAIASGVRSVGNRHRPSGVTYAITAVCSPAVAARQSAA